MIKKESNLNLASYDYELPIELIAQEALIQRGDARLLVLNRETQGSEHRVFKDILDYFQKGDVLVLNDTKVIPARLFGKKKTGGHVEILLLKCHSERSEESLPAGRQGKGIDPSAAPQDDKQIWSGLIKPSRRVKKGEIISFEESDELMAEMLDEPSGETGIRLLQFKLSPPSSPSPIEGEGKVVSENSSLLVGEDKGGGKIQTILNQIGHIPLPPYIDRKDKPVDRDLYQTVFARRPGAVASPTAGLHFDEPLLNQIRAKGVEIVFVTLHVGYGTFQPVMQDDLSEHEMHEEFYEIPDETAEIINLAKTAGRRVIACGTTVVRTLETAAKKTLPAEISSVHGNTRLFIYPPYEFKIVDAMITNFHLPKTTLLMLVSAFAGYEFMMKAYQEAIKERYRFFSYGDAMFII